MRTILHIMRKEIRHIRRDPLMLALVLVSPILQLIILGYAANLDVAELPVVVYDMDRSEASGELLDSFFRNEYFRYAFAAGSWDDIDRTLDEGTAEMAVVVPKDFTEDIAAGGTAEIQLIADGSNTNSAGKGMSYAISYLQSFSKELAVKRMMRSGRGGLQPAGVDPVIRIWYNPALESRSFMLPGILAQILMILTMLLTSIAIVKEKEQGTMEQLIVTPIQPYQLIWGKLLPFIVVGFINVIAIVIVTDLLFGLPVEGSFILLLALTAVFLLTTLGLGLLVSTVSRTQQQAMMTAVFFVLLPMLFLSGFVFPIESMPKIIQYITYLIPLRYYFTIIRGIFLKGVGLEYLWDETLILLLFGIGIIVFSTKRFQKRVG